MWGLDEYCGDSRIVTYDSARQEYREFCESLYPNEDFKFLVNDHRVFYSMVYTAMREQNPRGGNHKRNVLGMAAAALFKCIDYDNNVLERYAVWWDTDTPQELPHPTNPAGIESLTNYKAGVKAEWEHQVSLNSNTFSWDLIWTQRSKRIVNNVKKRKSAVKNFAEKLSHKVSPYLAVKRYPDMEQDMWE